VALNSGDYPLARTCFEPIAQQHPANVDIQMGYAIALRGQKEYEESEKIYDTLLKRDPTNRTLTTNAVMLHMHYTKKFSKAATILDGFLSSSAGKISPSDDIFKLKDEIKSLEEAEKKRKAEIERKRIEAEERAKRDAERLAAMDVAIKAMEADIAKYGDCLAASPTGVMDLVPMVIEQAKPVITEKDLAMVADMTTFVDDAKAQLADAVAVCAAATAPPAPAPAPEPAPAPAPAPEPAPAPAPG
jgi:tetratricopeptide (TPR) repeat protein